MNAVLQAADPFRIAYDFCPLCGCESEVVVRREQIAPRGNLPRDLTWLECVSCKHVHTQHYFNALGNVQLMGSVMEDGYFGGNLDMQRAMWGDVITRLSRWVASDDKRRWVDVGVGNGGFLFTAAEFGLNAVGIDTRHYILDVLRKYGYTVEQADATTYDYAGAVAVIMADVLEHIPFPKELLKRIRAQLKGPLFISCPNMDSISWRYMETTGGPVYWQEPEHYHNFTRARLQSLLKECGFTPMEYGVSTRYQAGMEIIAI